MILTIALAACAAFAQEKYDLTQVQGMEEFKGSEGARLLLATNGFVVTSNTFKQIFEPYIKSRIAHFITTDSAWHTYHVLLEEGLRTLADTEADLLKRFSARLLAAARAKGEGPYGDLSRYAAVGLALQDPNAVTDPEMKAAAGRVLEGLERGSGPLRILFFGLPIQVERLRAAGLYTKSPALRGYFSARQWYALLDFRAKSSEETLRAVLLALLIEGDRELADLYARLAGPYDALLGPPEDADVPAYARIVREAAGEKPDAPAVEAALGAILRAARARPTPRVNDQVLDPGQYVDFGQEIRGFRLLPPRRTPQAVLFQNAVHPAVPERRFPSGLDLWATGPLGCEAGRRALRKEEPGPAAEVFKAQAGPLGDSIHDRTLRLLAFLQEPLPETAPAPLRTDAWRDKELQTQLAAWAELQHSWALHSKLTVYYFGATGEIPGCVEPYPAFFRGLGDLSRVTAEPLSRAWSGVAVDSRMAGTKLAEWVGICRKLQQGERPPYQEHAKVDEFHAFLRGHLGTTSYPSKEDFAKVLEELEVLSRKCAEAAEFTDSERRVLRRVQGIRDIPTMLREFADLCDRLASTAAKCREGRPLEKADADLIRDYGPALGRFHFYDLNAWLAPKDDFPKAAPFFVSPFAGQALYAATARPESLLVILQVGGKAVLHEGAVLSYREFRRLLEEPLDDEAWQNEVQAGRLPVPLKFTESFRK